MTERLYRLERENRRLKRMAGLVVVGLAAVVVMGQAAPRPAAQKVEAEEFTLKDATGKIRGRLAVEADETVRLVLLDDKGKQRAVLAVAKDGSPRLGFRDADEKERTVMGVEPDGSPLLGILDKNGNHVWPPIGRLRKAEGRQGGGIRVRPPAEPQRAPGEGGQTGQGGQRIPLNPQRVPNVPQQSAPPTQ